ncbi:MAG: MOSC domain-containing protein [Firmicutes bacterium]|nr:MOSC domain-containing protein [Bacillota bacterium]
MAAGCVCAVCTSDKRGVSKCDQGRGYLKENFGLLEDAHAGPGERQVSILLEQHLEPVIGKLGCRPDPGSFAENLLVSGLPESIIGEGALLRAGEAVIQITGIGKDAAEGHSYSYEGFGLLAKRGLFGRVVKGGRVEVGDSVELIEGQFL